MSKSPSINVKLDLGTAPKIVHQMLNDHRLHDLFAETMGCVPYAFHWHAEEDIQYGDIVTSAIDGNDLDDIALEDPNMIQHLEAGVKEIVQWGINALNHIEHPLIAAIQTANIALEKEHKENCKAPSIDDGHGNVSKIAEEDDEVKTDFQAVSVIEHRTSGILEVEMRVVDVEMWGSNPPDFYTPRVDRKPRRYDH